MAQGDANFSDTHSKDRNYERFRTLSWIRESNSSRPHITTLKSYFATEYEEDIFNALEVIETDVSSGRPIHWNMFRQVLRGIRVKHTTVPFCFKFVTEIFSFFERYQCKDASVISEVFQFMFFLTIENLQYLKYDLSTEMIKPFYIPCGEESKIDLVWNTACCGNLGLLKLQLRFGMGMVTPPFTHSYFMRYIDIPFRFWPHNSASDSRDLKIILEELNNGNMYEKLCSHINPESWKRLWLVYRVSEIFRKMLIDSECRGNLTECYRLLFDSIPDAYVTSIEVNASLEKCLPDACSRFISKVAEDFERVCPELAGVPQPRSLQHLSRIQVRQSLHQNLNLPHGVSALPLPKKLKEYVMLHDDGDYSVIRSISFATLAGSQEKLHHYTLGLVMNIPEEGDCIPSFFKNL